MNFQFMLHLSQGLIFFGIILTGLGSFGAWWFKEKLENHNKTRSIVSQKPMEAKLLLSAVRSRDLNRVRELSQNPDKLDERGVSGQTPLIVAAMTDQFIIAETLLAAGADPFAADSFGWTAGVAVEESMLKIGEEFEAKKRFAQRLRKLGYPIPGPDTDEVKAMIESGNWPPADWLK